jgi:hypothetical protein
MTVITEKNGIVLSNSPITQMNCPCIKSHNVTRVSLSRHSDDGMAADNALFVSVYDDVMKYLLCTDDGYAFYTNP